MDELSPRPAQTRRARRAKPEAKSLSVTEATVPDPGGSLFIRLDEVISPIAKLLVMLTIVFGAWEYFDRERDARTEKSLEYVALWESGGYREAYSSINASLYPIFASAREGLSSLEPEAKVIALGNIGDRLTGADDRFDTLIEEEVDQVFYFFDRMSLCANEGICEASVLRAFLGDDVSSFWSYFSRYAARKDEAGYKDFGLWTRRFADAN